MFIKWQDFWDGEPSEEDVEMIYKRKEGAPTRAVKLADGTELDVWCTFSDEQVDINAFGEKGQEFIECELEELAKRCARLLTSYYLHAHLQCPSRCGPLWPLRKEPGRA